MNFGGNHLPTRLPQAPTLRVTCHSGSQLHALPLRPAVSVLLVVIVLHSLCALLLLLLALFSALSESAGEIHCLLLCRRFLRLAAGELVLVHLLLTQAALLQLLLSLLVSL